MQKASPHLRYELDEFLARQKMPVQIVIYAQTDTHLGKKPSWPSDANVY
jgi:hypothetical protein